MTAEFDHLVWATPDLEALVAEVTAQTGVAPRPGGRHEGHGTRNYLLGLGGRRYLELIGPDPDQPDPGQPRPFAVDALDAPAVVGWAVRTDDIAGMVVAARDRGYDPGEPRPMSRREPGGASLRWILTPPPGGYGGTVPFVIDWLGTAHPSIALPHIDLVSLTLRHPEPERVVSALRALSVAEVDVRAGDVPGIEAVLGTPRGTVRVT